MNKWSIYIHMSPNGKVYVGQTCRKPKRRWGNGSGYKTQVLFYRAIVKYGWNSFEHKILFENLSKLDADLIETDLIYYYKKISKSYNITDGGAGVTGFKISEEKRQELSKRMRGEKNPFYGKRHSDETKKRFSETRRGRSSPNKGKKMSLEFCKKNSEAHMGISKGEKNGMWGRRRTEEEKLAVKIANSVPVTQFDLNGNFIKDWDSIADVRRELGIGHISECCRGKCKTSGGYIWKYKNETI